jgi:hypothetical protein
MMISKVYTITFNNNFTIKDLYNLFVLIIVGCTPHNKEGYNE